MTDSLNLSCVPASHRTSFRLLKRASALVCFLILASNIWAILHWNERRGVWDDLCYLRQAHLFQRFGLSDGLNTDISRDDDKYFASMEKEIGQEPTASVCHTSMASGARVIQFPAGVGFLLSLFPEGYQVKPFHIVAHTLVFLFALSIILLANTPRSLTGCAAFGCITLYFMINPAKASYSMAPTLVLCAVLGFLTAFVIPTKASMERTFGIAAIGLILGLSVNLRIANLFLATGYFVFFFVSFLKSLSVEKIQSGGLFSLTFLAGISPTLVANNVNAGSPFRTTYPPGDVLVFDPLSSAYYYFTDTQGALVALAISLAVYALLTTKAKAIKIVCCIVAINISVNLAFFLTITYTTQYYLLPFTMLSCWSILFALLREDRQQAAMACR